MMPDQQQLRLIALEPDDLRIISTHAQDAILRPTDIAWLERNKRFTMIINRFNWESAEEKKPKEQYQRRRAALNFDRVLNVQRRGIEPGSEEVLELLAVDFVASDAPAGEISLVFAGGAMIRLEVECVEVQLEDLGAAWSTKMRPDHDTDVDQD